VFNWLAALPADADDCTYMSITQTHDNIHQTLGERKYQAKHKNAQERKVSTAAKSNQKLYHQYLATNRNSCKIQYSY